MPKKIAKLLIKHKLTISIAESVTGGLISNAFTDIPGSSAYFLGGVVAYSNFLKMKLLGVKKETLKKYGAVSEIAAKNMAQGIRKITGSDIGISTTGIAGPTGATANKPVGLVYIALSFKNKIIVKKFLFKGKRLAIKKQTLWKTIEILKKMLEE